MNWHLVSDTFERHSLKIFDFQGDLSNLTSDLVYKCSFEWKDPCQRRSSLQFAIVHVISTPPLRSSRLRQCTEFHVLLKWMKDKDTTVGSLKCNYIETVTAETTKPEMVGLEHCKNDSACVTQVQDESPVAKPPVPTIRTHEWVSVAGALDFAAVVAKCATSFLLNGSHCHDGAFDGERKGKCSNVKKTKCSLFDEQRLYTIKMGILFHLF
ncbi:hypothetical protein RB195_013670 [Necator americanus]|uniref:Uncharacterized protein n=1 Tax=Necator americanus TaxID=51031 RepID=A0ABR1DX97_NECAM